MLRISNCCPAAYVHASVEAEFFRTCLPCSGSGEQAAGSLGAYYRNFAHEYISVYTYDVMFKIVDNCSVLMEALSFVSLVLSQCTYTSEPPLQAFSQALQSNSIYILATFHLLFWLNIFCIAWCIFWAITNQLMNMG